MMSIQTETETQSHDEFKIPNRLFPGGQITAFLCFLSNLSTLRPGGENRMENQERKNTPL